MIGVAAGTRPDQISVKIRFADGVALDLPVQPADGTDRSGLVHAALTADLSEHPGPCTVTVRAAGRSYRERYELGPGHYSGRLDGVRGYSVEGWVSPLFACPTPIVQLIVDGAASEPMPVDRYRREFRSLHDGRYGWNGVSLPLPSRALDGKPHHLSVRAGQTTLVLGTWCAQPEYHIDAIAPRSLRGWYFDHSAIDAPTSLRIVRNGVTRSEVATHFRKDIKAVHGRDAAGFAFLDAEVSPGSLLVAGPEGRGLVLGRIGRDLLDEVRSQRASARASLLASLSGPGGSDSSLPARRAIRERIAGSRRSDDEGLLAFRLLLAAESAFDEMRSGGPLPTASRHEGEGPEPRRDPAIGEAPASPRRPPPVCAVVPVYKGLSDLMACLDSLIPQLRVGDARAIVINDGSPDPEIGRYLGRLAAESHPGLTILENPTNLGFIGTVNRGFSLLKPGEDVLLVNADTILPPGGIGRLARHCHARPGIASVTPMSNNATILSFPDATRANPAPLGLPIAETDRAFAERSADPVEIPTGIGFCMHLNRSALDEVGLFSPEWGRGYCEEVDWCLGARDLGWIHLAATDVFVMHEGSVSFGVAERLTIMETNHAKLEARYPEYDQEVRAFIRNDPLETVRTDVLLRLLAGRFTSLTVHLTHGLGGGTKRYVDDLKALPREPGHEVATLLPGEGQALMLRFDGAEAAIRLTQHEVERAFTAMQAAGVRLLLHVNSRLNFHSQFLRAVLSGRWPYVVMLHDFQWYCPRVHLTDGRTFYCDEPPPSVCQLCVSGGVEHGFADHHALIEHDLESWLRFNETLLAGASVILSPSADTARRYARRFDLPEIVVAPHPEPRRDRAKPVVARSRRSAGGLRIAVVGAIGAAKGFDLLVRIVERAARDRLPLFLTVIGYTRDDRRLQRYGNVEITGAYEPAELDAKLAEADPDFVFIPSVWPETYSYVLSEIWNAGYPVVAFDIGAPADRIRADGGGVLIPLTRDTGAILDGLMAAGDRIASLSPGRPEPAAVASLEAYYHASRANSDTTRPQPDPGQTATAHAAIRSPPPGGTSP